MHNKLLLKAFEKARKEIQTDKKTRLAKHLSDFIFENSGEMYGEKSLRNHFNIIQKSEPIELKSYVTHSLSKYLGYHDFSHFIKENADVVENSKNNLKPKMKSRKVIYASSLALTFAGILGYQVFKKDCMVWENRKYKSVNCDLKTSPKLIPYDKMLLKHQKQVTPDCYYPFFTSDGHENLWYGKSAKGEMQYFTLYGLHPVTGKTLKPITQYMIDKYICH